MSQSPTAQPSSVPQLLQLPAPILQLVYLHLPWYDRLLHVAHVHCWLPAAWLVWSESDYVRLSESLLDAVEAQSPSAVHCCLHVQSLYVSRVMCTTIMGDAEDDYDSDERENDLKEQHAGIRLKQCVQQCMEQQQQVELRSVHAQQSTAPPFSNVRFLFASQRFLQLLLQCTQLSVIHSLSLTSLSGSIDPEENTTVRPVDELLSSLPTLRRVRLDNAYTLYQQLFAMPDIEHLDVRNSYVTEREEAGDAPTPLTLRRLMLQQVETELGEGPLSADALLASLLPTSLQQLSISARLTNDNLLTLTQLSSLTALELRVCYFDDTNALGHLMSDTAEPLLPYLQRIVIEGCDADDIDYDDMRTSTAAFLRAYSAQLRHITLAVKTDPANSLDAVLTAIVSRMPQLETLTLAVASGYHDSSAVVHLIDVDYSSGQQRQPALHSLRSLTLRNLPMADTAVDQLLSYCPHLLELTIDRVAPLTAAIWISLQRCRQLLSLCFASASVVATEAAFVEAAASSIASSSNSFSSTSSSSSASVSHSAVFPFLVHLSLAFQDSAHIDYPGFTRLLGLFAGSPIRTLALRLYDGVDQRLYFRQLAALPHLARVLVQGSDGQYAFSAPPWVDGVSAPLSMIPDSDEERYSAEQHAVSMRYYWRSGLSEERDELIEKYAAGVNTPVVWLGNACSWRLAYVRAGLQESEMDRAAFLQSLETDTDTPLPQIFGFHQLTIR